MSYPTPPAAAGPRIRPGAVQTAGVLLYIMALCRVIDLIISISQDLTSTLGTLEDVVAAVLWIVIGTFVLRGVQGWRVTAFVFAGLELLCGSIVAIILAAGSDALGSVGLSYSDLLPGWVIPVVVTELVIQVVAALLVIILLAQRSSSPYFRQPPLAYAPGYPPVPGQYLPPQPPQAPYSGPAVYFPPQQYPGQQPPQYPGQQPPQYPGQQPPQYPGQYPPPS